MTEGTRTLLVGSHSIIHSFLVVKAWKIIYGNYPKFWQLICIFIHDIGYWGTNYHTDKSNNGHAELGARIARRLFGKKGFELVAGHSRSTAMKFNIPLSDLEAPDDYSWIIAPTWWLRLLKRLDHTSIDGLIWRDLVIKNWEENGMFNRGPAYDLYLKNIQRFNDK